MDYDKIRLIFIKGALAIGAAAVLLVAGPRISLAQQEDWHPAENQSFKDPAEIRGKFHLRGKTRGNVFPTEAIFGQIFVNTKDGREWIFDGQQWVPHDNTVDAYYEYLKTVKKSLPGQQCSPAAPQGSKEGTR